MIEVQSDTTKKDGTNFNSFAYANNLMTFSEYQRFAKETAIYPEEHKVVYPTISLAGEVGELCNKVKKALRGDYSINDKKEELAGEIGDVLWYLSAICSDLNLNLDTIAKENIEKLFSRKERGVLQGSGDNR